MLVIVDCSVSLADMLNILNGFDTNIVCTADNSENGSRVNFLDLALRIYGSSVDFQTYRKPLCSYMYTPADSCHSSSTFSGIVSTELHRLIQTNASEATYMYHVEFFIGKLLKCGYDLKGVRSIVSRFNWANKGIVLAKRERVRSQIIPFKIAYTANASQLYISSTLRKHQDILNGHLGDTRFLTAFRTNPNIFRVRFKDKYF